jgi:hypothetical protein
MNLTKWQFISTILVVWILSSIVIEIAMLQNLKINYDIYKIQRHKNIPDTIAIIDGIMTFSFLLYWGLFIYPKIMYFLKK